jgi:hypothetical protein
MIVIVVSDEPTTLDDGLIEATAGVGFEVDVELDEAGIAPPQPDRNPRTYTTDAINTDLNRSIGGSPVQAGFELLSGDVQDCILFVAFVGHQLSLSARLWRLLGDCSYAKSCETGFSVSGKSTFKL